MAIETGHYSNGQTGAAFSTEFEDESEEGQAVYETITDDTDLSAILNRKSGNFSTNLSRLSFNYRVNRFDTENNPKRIHSYTFTYQLYHNNFMGLFDFIRGELIEVIDSASEIERKDLKREFDNFIKNPCLATKKIFYSWIIDLQELVLRKMDYL